MPFEICAKILFDAQGRAAAAAFDRANSQVLEMEGTAMTLFRIR
jgi:hypothetical protein